MSRIQRASNYSGRENPRRFGLRSFLSMLGRKMPSARRSCFEQLEERQLLWIGPYVAAEEAALPHETAGAVEVGAATTALPSEVPVLDACGNAMASDRIIVRFADNVKLASVGNLAKSLDGTVLENLSIIHGAVIEVSNPGSAQAISSAIALWEAQPGVCYAEPDYQVQVTATIPDDELFDNLWAMNNTGQTGGTADADIDAVGGFKSARQMAADNQETFPGRPKTSRAIAFVARLRPLARVTAG